MTGVAARLAVRPEVVAIAVSGSTRGGLADAHSDIDLYVFQRSGIPVPVSWTIASGYPRSRVGNDWFGENDTFTDPASAIDIDVNYFDAMWLEVSLRRVLEQHQPALGYTTALSHTVQQAHALHDPSGWLRALQALTNAPYPEPLREAIIAYNLPLLRSTRASYRHQIELAVVRNDPVSINHRLAAFLTSVFDIAFASHRTLHPGEKRLLTHLEHLEGDEPVSLADGIRIMLLIPRNGLLAPVEHVCDRLDRMITT